MADRFIVTGLDFMPQKTNPNRQIARLTVMHARPVGSPGSDIRIDPIETSVTKDEALTLRDTFYAFKEPMVMELESPGNGQHFLQHVDSSIRLIVPPRALHR